MEITTTLSVWFILMIFLGISINGGLSQGQQHLVKKTRPSVVVVGTVYCDTCFNGAFSRSPNHLIPGALVAVECVDDNAKPSFRQEVKTDEHGEFKAKLPFSVSKHVKRIKRCSVKLLSSSQPYCSVASSATSASLKRLKSSKHEESTRVFSAGFFTFKPESQPEICSQKPINLRGSKPLLPDPAFPPPIQDPVPNNPSPLPNLPIVLPLPNLPLPTPQKSASLHNKKDSSLVEKNPVTRLLSQNPLNPPLLPPNPLNSPSLTPPSPLIPSPPTLPPLPFQPHPSGLLPPLPLIPTIPVITPPVITPPVITPPVITPPVITPPVITIPGFPVITPPVITPPVITPPVITPPVITPPVITLPPIIPGKPPASASFASHHQP